MQVTDEQINAIVNNVVTKLVGNAPQKQETPNPVPQIPSQQISTAANETIGAYSDIDSAINAAEKAYHQYKNVSLAQRKQMIEAIRDICMENVKEISQMGVEESKMGRYEDKIRKNTAAILRTPGVEDLEPIAFSGDDGVTLIEKASYGVIGSITPCTNPSETIICNGIGMIAAGNAVAFNPHPTAKKTSVFTINLINKAIIAAGGPPNLLTTIISPTIESAQILMKHPKVRLLVVTGGPGVVAVAMKSGKRVIAAGPGNPPVVVDETADLDKAAHDIVTSASTDNNIICVIEKIIIATKKCADEFKRNLIKHGAVELNSHQSKRLEKVIVDGNHPNKKWVGKNVQEILREIGMEVDSTKRLAIAETGPDHPFAKIELLMPVLPFIRANDIDEAIDMAYELEGGRFHTAALHSKNIEHLHKMAVKMNTSIFVKNGPALAGLGLGGEGPISFTIASPTGEGVTTARHFTRLRRCVISGYFRIV